MSKFFSKVNIIFLIISLIAIISGNNIFLFLLIIYSLIVIIKTLVIKNLKDGNKMFGSMIVFIIFYFMIFGFLFSFVFGYFFLLFTYIFNVIIPKSSKN